jgi:hypothetical protein
VRQNVVLLCALLVLWCGFTPAWATKQSVRMVPARDRIEAVVSTSPRPWRVGDEVELTVSATSHRQLHDVWLYVRQDDGRDVIDHFSLDAARHIDEMNPGQPVVIRKTLKTVGCGLFHLRFRYSYSPAPGAMATSDRPLLTGLVHQKVGDPRCKVSDEAPNSALHAPVAGVGQR